MKHRFFMYLVDCIKQFIADYYPRKYLIAAIGLLLVLTGMLVMPADGTSSTLSVQSQRPGAPSEAIPLTDEDATRSSKIAPAQLAIEPSPTSGTPIAGKSDQWKQVEVRSGDTLSAIFHHVLCLY